MQQIVAEEVVAVEVVTVEVVTVEVVIVEVVTVEVVIVVVHIIGEHREFNNSLFIYITVAYIFLLFRRSEKTAAIVGGTLYVSRRYRRTHYNDHSCK